LIFGALRSRIELDLRKPSRSDTSVLLVETNLYRALTDRSKNAPVIPQTFPDNLCREIGGRVILNSAFTSSEPYSYVSVRQEGVKYLSVLTGKLYKIDLYIV
jgi:hypothetical protein